MIKVIGRELQIPQSERKLGFESDNLVETRKFYITDKELFDLSFKLDVAEYGCTVDLDKSTMPDGSGIILMWTVTSGIMQNSGRINVQLRAFDSATSLVWHSEMQTFFVGESVNALKEIENVPLGEFEQVEKKATAAKDEAVISAQLAKEYAQQSMNASNDANERLEGHKADKDNPHGVTAEQVGAYSTEETDELLSSKAQAEHVHECAVAEPEAGDSNGGMNAGALFESGKDGFMSAEDKRKLDGIEEGATKTVVDANISDVSDNPISNKAVAMEFDHISELLSKKTNSSEFSLHVSDEDNPHGVTAEQVGAYTKAETRNYVFSTIRDFDFRLAPLCGNEIDDFDKIVVEQLFFYSQFSLDGEQYAHAPFEWGLIISHDFPGYISSGDRDYKQIGISLDEGSYGKIFERTLVDNTPLTEGDSSYDLANTDWTVASYGKEELDNLFATKEYVKGIDDKFNNIPNATYSKGEMEFTTDNVTVVSGESDATWRDNSFSTMGDTDIPVVYHIAVSGNVEFYGTAVGAMYSIEIDGETSIPTDDFGRFSYIGNVKNYIEVSVKYASIDFETFVAEKCIDGFMTGMQVKELTEHGTDIEGIRTQLGDIDTALDELHAYAQGIAAGGVSE